MRIEIDQTVCPACGASALQFYPILHHLICAYIGPVYDFAESRLGFVCPKCRREIVSGDQNCEIIGTSARCCVCWKEMVVSPSTAAPPVGFVQSSRT